MDGYMSSPCVSCSFLSLRPTLGLIAVARRDAMRFEQSRTSASFDSCFILLSCSTCTRSAARAAPGPVVVSAIGGISSRFLGVSESAA
eukprot:2663364-Pleurochrysis_carterae.AAC.1